MMLKMQKIILSLTYIFLSISAYSQDESYPYFRIASIPVRYSVLDSVEFRGAENEQFKVASNSYGSFDARCLLHKFKSVFFYYNSGISRLTGSDSFVFVNNKPVERLQFSNNRLSNRSTFVTSADSKIDTIETQHYNNLHQIVNMTRTILYRNRLGKDSLFKEEYFRNGGWQLGQEYHEFFYDDLGRLIQRKLGGYYLMDTFNIYSRNQTTNYIYSGNFLMTQIDSFANSIGSPIDTQIDSIYKWHYQYDTLGRLSEGINSFRALQNLDTTFTPNIRNRYTEYNRENKNTVYYTDNWKNNTWVETNMNIIRYTNHNLSQSSFRYSKTGSNWWLRSKVFKEYCGVISALQEETTPDFNLKIYPNPAQNSVTLEGNDNATSKNNLQVFDYAGRLILQQKEVVLPHTVDVSKLSDGLYFFKINNEKGQSTTRKVLIMK